MKIISESAPVIGEPPQICYSGGTEGAIGNNYRLADMLGEKVGSPSAQRENVIVHLEYTSERRDVSG